MNRRETKPKVRRWKSSDIPGLVRCHQAIYSDFPAEELWGARKFKLQFDKFPEGQFLVEKDGQIIGYACSIIVELDDEEHYYTYSEITGAGTFTTHFPGGDTLYGADIGVHPDFRGQGVASLLYGARKKLLKRYNLRRMVAHGRIPGFREYSGRMTAEEYVAAVKKGTIRDPALRAHIKSGYSVKKVLIDIVRDAASMNYATWLEMKNPEFNTNKHKISSQSLKRMTRKIRVCAAQFEMRKISSWEEFANNVDFFVESASSSHSHFLVLPELFTAALFSTFDPKLNDRQAITELAKYTDKYRNLLSSKAKKHGMYIIGGTHPVIRDKQIYNVSHLFCPSGKFYEQDKLHITPAERAAWNIQAGEAIRIFETPYARIAIQVCYDIEFPEVSRMLTLAGAEVLFVPFSTEERKAYNRVRHCAMARAIENYVYVVISGNCGNLPSVRSYLLNYAQSAIITPSDFAFPAHGLEGEADPNTETVVVADLDLTTLHLQREIGTVRPLYDRRADLYELKPKVNIELIRAY